MLEKERTARKLYSAQPHAALDAIRARLMTNENRVSLPLDSCRFDVDRLPHRHRGASEKSPARKPEAPGLAIAADVPWYRLRCAAR